LTYPPKNDRVFVSFGNNLKKCYIAAEPFFFLAGFTMLRGVEMKKIVLYACITVLFSGCTTVQRSSSLSQPTMAFSEKETLESKISQSRAIAETSMEVSKNAEKYAQEAYNTANQANATSEKVLEAANKAISASQEAVKSANEASEKAIKAANEASAKAIAASDKSSKLAMAHADDAAKRSIAHSDEAAKRATDAANRSVAASNEASAKSIAAANLTMAELGRIKAAQKTESLEPVLDNEPKLSSFSSAKTYTVRSGDTLGGIAQKFYGSSSQWKRIWDANRKIVKSPQTLPVGVVLTLPPRL